MVGYNERELTELYGAPARFSEHQRGDVVRFRSDGQELTGTIIWICAPVMPRGLRLVYAVQCGNQEPVFVHPVNVLT